MRRMATRRWLLGVYIGGGLAAVLLVVLLARDGTELEGDAAPASTLNAVSADASAVAHPAAGDDGTATAASSPRFQPLWQPVEPSAVDPADIPAFAYVADVPGKALVRVAPLAAPRAVGDSIEVEIPQLNAAFQLVVERVQEGPGSTRSVSGDAVDGNGGRHTFVLTTGPRTTFARIGTPRGAYELAANRELGWLMPAANMDRHVDYSKPDTYIVRPGGPDRPGQETERPWERAEERDAFKARDVF